MKTQVPVVFEELETLGLPDAARTAWQDWNAAGEGEAAALADALDQLGPPLFEAVDALRNRAASRLDTLEDAWKPRRLAVAAFADQARKAQKAHSRVRDLRKAKEWVDTYAL